MWSVGSEHSTPDTSQDRGLGKLLVTQDTFRLPESSEGECAVERLENVGCRAELRPDSPQCMDHQTCYRIGPTRAAGSRCHVIPVDPLLPRESESLSSLSLSRLAPVLVSDIRSPSSLSSDFDDHLSHRSLSTSSLSHSGATTPTKSSPERFLFFESEESDHDWGHPVPNGNQGDAHYMQFRGVPHKGKRMGRTRSGWGSSSDFEEVNDALQPFPGDSPAKCVLGTNCM